jgi:hypothetical protein
MNRKESLLENINLHCESISKYVMDNGEGMKHRDVLNVRESLEAISARARELVVERSEEEESATAQVCVLFKNKYLMAAKAKRSDAMDVSVLWRIYRENPGKETDAFITIGCDEEILMFSLSSVDAIKILFSQKDIGL